MLTNHVGHLQQYGGKGEGEGLIEIASVMEDDDEINGGHCIVYVGL